MSNLLSRLFRTKGHGPTHHVVDHAFVSEHTRFIGHYLEEHPEVLDDQHKGWRIYWDKKVDLVAQKKAEMDTVPDDIYGFHNLPRTDKQH